MEKIMMDLHTHTIESGHAYSTLEENIRAAKEAGIKYYGLSEHGPAMPGSPHIYYFQNMRVIPREINGVTILRGVEANIINDEGEIDMIPEWLKFIDYVIASVHIPVLPYRDKSHNTRVLVNAIKNPKVHIIGHPDDGRFPIDYETVVLAAKENQVLLEVNNASLNPIGFRQDAKKNSEDMLKLCMKEKVSVILSSDAHISMDVGNFEYIFPILEKINFPKELIMNYFPERFMEFIHFNE